MTQSWLPLTWKACNQTKLTPMRVPIGRMPYRRTFTHPSKSSARKQGRLGSVMDNPSRPMQSLGRRNHYLR